MALLDGTYGTVERVQSLIGDIVDSREFTDSTIPSLTQVRQALDDVAAQLNMELRQSGYTAPVDQSTDPETYSYLRMAGSAGAAAMVLSTLPAESWIEPDQERPAQGRRQWLESQLNRAIKLVREGRLPVGRTGKGFTAFAGSQEDSDGKTKKPLFTRGQTDFPGSRSLTED